MEKSWKKPWKTLGNFLEKPWKILKRCKPQNLKSLFLTLGWNRWKWSSALCLEIFSVSNEKSNLIGSVRAKQICSLSLMDRALPLFFNQFVCPIESSSHVFCNQTEKKLVCSSLLLYYSNFFQEKEYLSVSKKMKWSKYNIFCKRNP